MSKKQIKNVIITLGEELCRKGSQRKCPRWKINHKSKTEKKRDRLKERQNVNGKVNERREPDIRGIAKGLKYRSKI